MNEPLVPCACASKCQAVSLRRQIEALKREIEMLKTDKEAAFSRGYLIACCNIEHMHHEEGVAFDVLAELQLSRSDVRRMNLTDYDKKALRRIENARGQSLFREGRKERNR
ncbi:hypothetical protein [Brucella intermedia]|uniref:Uncharacterized protein n=1 Tax=Brucella intermedia M86 TaxID=1234597 RepID=M5K512_9HYPH|nr:hypothetical protein [Brucella intermedia]ELT50991.1 hypothetical protein D584_01318 [Brucella intermedia M86]